MINRNIFHKSVELSSHQLCKGLEYSINSPKKLNLFTMMLEKSQQDKMTRLTTATIISSRDDRHPF